MVHTVAGKAVLVALTFPMILEFLPILLPRHFSCLLDMVCWQRKTEENNDMDGEEVPFQDKMLTKLDEILKNKPWKLGFSRVSNVKQGKKNVVFVHLSFIRIHFCFSYTQFINWVFVGGKLSSFGNGLCTGVGFSTVFFFLVGLQ